MDSKKLAQKGDVVTTSKDATILSSIQLDKIMEQDLIRLSPDQKLGEFIEILRKTKQTIFPVVLENQQLVGIIELNNVIESLFDQAKYDSVQVSDLMSSPKTWIQKDQNILEIMKKFEQTTTAVLPVIDQGKFIGFIHKNKLLEAYRDQLLRTTARI
jgi:CIC family chloride channel protein